MKKSDQVNGLIFIVAIIVMFIVMCFVPRLFGAVQLEVNPFFYGIHQDQKIITLKSALKYSQDNFSYGAKINHSIFERDEKYENSSHKVFFNYINKSVYYKSDYGYDDSRDEFTGGLYVGYIPLSWFNFCVGYNLSAINDISNMLAVKTNYIVSKNLKYKYHIRSAFTEDRMFEWWQQMEYNVSISKNVSFKLRVQFDRQFGFTEQELENVVVFKWGVK